MENENTPTPDDAANSSDKISAIFRKYEEELKRLNTIYATHPHLKESYGPLAKEFVENGGTTPVSFRKFSPAQNFPEMEKEAHDKTLGELAKLRVERMYNSMELYQKYVLGELPPELEKEKQLTVTNPKKADYHPIYEWANAEPPDYAEFNRYYTGEFRRRETGTFKRLPKPDDSFEFKKGDIDE